MANIKILNAQISIFLSDGIMNPTKYTSVINKVFENVFSNEILSLNVTGVPDDMPLVRYTSESEDYAYDFARKRINFYISFKSFGGENELNKYINKIENFINNNLIVVTGISRIGIACVYYINDKDADILYWNKKYNLPFATKKTSEMSYTINNPFTAEGLNFNKIINLTTGMLKNSKVVPVVSVDVNNNEVENLSIEQLEYIMNNLNCYRLDDVETLLNGENK